MASPTSEQNFSNHVRFDPAFHFFVAPVFAITFITEIVRAVRNPSIWNFWSIVVAAAAVTAVLLIRVYALKVQDRVIRLEERLRLNDAAAGLMERQLVALRFASDMEAPALARRAAAENLAPHQIKEAVRVWKPDNWRV